MEIRVHKTDLKSILSLRSLFLQECNFQIRYNACHERNWSDSYLFTANGVQIGYGSVKGKDNLADRDAVFEFYIVPHFRNLSSQFFKELTRISGVTFIKCQSNDKILSFLLYEFSDKISSDVILFEDGKTTDLKLMDTVFRHKKESDSIFQHTCEPVGSYVLEQQGKVVATGGFMLHYNFPFADLYMEVKASNRRVGLGSFLIQELKKECYLNGRVPAARCNIENTASRNTLIRGGLKICGYMLSGTIKGVLVS